MGSIEMLDRQATHGLTYPFFLSESQSPRQDQVEATRRASPKRRAGGHHGAPRTATSIPGPGGATAGAVPAAGDRGGGQAVVELHGHQRGRKRHHPALPAVHTARGCEYVCVCMCGVGDGCSTGARKPVVAFSLYRWMTHHLHIPTAHGHTQVSRNLLKRATSEVRRALKDVQSISFDIRGEDLKERVRGSGLIDRLIVRGPSPSTLLPRTKTQTGRAPLHPRHHPAQRCLLHAALHHHARE